MPGRRLVVVSERDHEFIDLDDKATLSIGRAPENDIIVKDDMVSRRHCLLEVLPGGGLRVRDLKSFNGTYLNERRVREETMGLWDAVRVGRTKMVLVDRLADPPTPAGEGDAKAAPPPQAEPEPEDMGKTRTMDLPDAGDVGALLASKELRGVVDGIVRREREELERQVTRRLRDESGPTVLGSLAGFQVRVRRTGPADGGGDMYDSFNRPLHPRELDVCLGTVSGVGIPACVAATTARHTLRGACALSTQDDPQQLVEGLADVLSRTLHPGSALSLLLARVADTGKVRVGAMGGTGALLYKAASDEVEVLRAPGRRDEEAVRVEALELTLRDDDRLLLVSDGAGACRAKPDGEPFGVERLRESLASCAAGGRPPKELLTSLLEGYASFSGGLPERDVTLLVLAKVSG